MSEENGKVCCNCRHNHRIGQVPDIVCHCSVTGRTIGYVECVTGWCRHWSRERRKNDGE